MAYPADGKAGHLLSCAGVAAPVKQAVLTDACLLCPSRASLHLMASTLCCYVPKPHPFHTRELQQLQVAVTTKVLAKQQLNVTHMCNRISALLAGPCRPVISLQHQSLQLGDTAPDSTQECVTCNCLYQLQSCEMGHARQDSTPALCLRCDLRVLRGTCTPWPSVVVTGFTSELHEPREA